MSFASVDQEGRPALFKDLMSPAKAASLAVLMAALLSAPLWIAGAVGDRIRHATPARENGPFPAIGYLSEDGHDVDVLFVGSSNMWAAVDHSALAGSYGKITGRQISSLTLAHNWYGPDIDYLNILNYLNNNHAKLIVIEGPRKITRKWPHPASKYFLDVWSDDGFFWSLPGGLRASLYAEQVLVAPRLLFGSLTGESADTAEVRSWVADRGALIRRASHSENDTGGEPPFRMVSTSVPSYDPGDLLISEARAGSDIVATEEAPADRIAAEWERAFWNRIRQLAEQRGMRVIFFHLPTLQDPVDAIRIRSFELEGGFAAYGLSMEEFLPGADEAYRRQFFYDREHFNANGARHFGDLMGTFLARGEGEWNSAPGGSAR